MSDETAKPLIAAAQQNLADGQAHLAAAAAALDPPMPPPVAVTGLRVVQWNTHHGGIPVTAGGSDQPLRVRGITDALIGCLPDVVALQELEEQNGYGHTDQLETHRAALEAAQGVPWFAAFCSMSGSGTRAGGGIGVLSRWPCETVARKAVSGRPMLSVAQPWGSLFALHPVAGDPVACAAQIAAFVTWAAGFPGAPIICGDFNAPPTDAALAPLRAAYRDAWTAAPAGGATSFTANGITHGAHRIDAVFVRGWRVVTIDVPDLRDAAEVYPSDHHPVVVTLAWDGSAGA